MSLWDWIKIRERQKREGIPWHSKPPTVNTRECLADLHRRVKAIEEREKEKTEAYQKLLKRIEK